ncbi:hypothetical protein P3T39_000729 [Kitasatospora sp. GP82]|nr:hypothetical protein [Kitasatospora sp. GP82]
MTAAAQENGGRIEDPAAAHILWTGQPPFASRHSVRPQRRA